MGTSKDPASDVAARFLADLRANTTRTADQRVDPASHTMALATLDLFGRSAGEAIIMASRLAARSPEGVAADRAEIAAMVEGLAEGAPTPTAARRTGPAASHRGGGQPGPDRQDRLARVRGCG